MTTDPAVSGPAGEALEALALLGEALGHSVRE
jgi:hypothetical protein